MKSNSKEQIKILTPQELFFDAIKTKNVKEFNVLLPKINLKTTDPQGNTALLWAVIHNNIEALQAIARQLVTLDPDEEKKQLNIKDNAGKNALMLAIESENVGILDWLMKYKSGALVTETGNDSSLFEYAIQTDSVNSFLHLFCLSLSLENKLDFKKIYTDFKQKIKEFFDYKTDFKLQGKKLSVYDLLVNNSSVLKNDGRKISYILDRLKGEFTFKTDSESSDSEDEDLHTINDTLKNSLKEGDIVLSRGLHFSKKYFPSSTEKKAAKTDVFHKKSAYSGATEEIAKQKPAPLDEADSLVKSYLELLKLTPNKPKCNIDYKPLSPSKQPTVHKERKIFDSLYFHLVHTYVNPTFKDLIPEGYLISTFNSPVNKLPFISTSKDFLVAFRYSSGERVTNCEKLIPTARVNGSFKHRRLGCVQVYLVDKEYEKYITNVDELNSKEKIGISSNYRHNQEFLLHSSIPEKFVLGYQVFSLPKMNKEWIKDIEKKYGLKKKKYDAYLEMFRLAKNKEELEKSTEALIEDVTEKQSENLKQKINDIKNKNISSNLIKFGAIFKEEEKFIPEKCLNEILPMNKF